MSIHLIVLLTFTLLYSVILLIECLNIGLFTPVAIYERFKNRWSKRKAVAITAEEREYGVSVIVPAYNEEATIIDTVRALEAQNYNTLQIIVVNDASNDLTLDLLMEEFKLTPSEVKPAFSLSATQVNGIYASPNLTTLTVIDKMKSGKGKADALNVGLGFAEHELVCTVDADSLLDPDALNLITKPFQKHPEQVVVGGTVRVGNGSRLHELRDHRPRFNWNPFVLFQSLEYLKMSYIDRVVLSTFNGIYLVAGAFGVFKKDVLKEVGGYRHDSLAEDLDLTIRIHRHFIEKDEAYRISHVPNATCWTEAPYNWTQLLRQRVRWQGGFVKTIFENKDMIFNKKYGLLGCLILPIHALMIAEVFFVLAAFYALFLASQIYPWDRVVFGVFIGHFIGNLVYITSVLLGESHLKKTHIFQSAGRVLVWFFFGRIYDLICLGFRLIGTCMQFTGKLTWGEMKRAGFQ